MPPFAATALLLLMVSTAQTEAQATGARGPPGTPGPSKTLAPCPTVSSKSAVNVPGEPACLGLIPCEIPSIPPL